ncbi:MAG: hypothetical protein K6C34_03300 [Alphaproteobacteria bacterium]|nr:hypothetical protein [Alphaproteobacteria bacterium]
MKKRIFTAVFAAVLAGNVHAQCVVPSIGIGRELPLEGKVDILTEVISNVSKSPLLTRSMRELFAQFPLDKIPFLMEMYKRSLVPVAHSLTETEQVSTIEETKEKAKVFFATVLLGDESDLGKQLYAKAEQAIDEGHYTFYALPAEAFYNSHASLKKDSPSETEIFCGYYNADSLLCTIAHEVGHVLDNFYSKKIAKTAAKGPSEHASMFFENLLYSSEYGKSLLSSDYSFKNQRLMQIFLEGVFRDFEIKFLEQDGTSFLNKTGRVDCDEVRKASSVSEYSGTPEGEKNGVIDLLGIRDAVLLTMAHECHTDRPNKILQDISGELTAEELEILNQAIATQKDPDVIKRLKQIRDNNASLIGCALDWEQLKLKTYYSGSCMANMDADSIEIYPTFSQIPRDDTFEPELASVGIEDIISKKSEFFRRRALDEDTIKVFLGNLILGLRKDSKKFDKLATVHVAGLYHAWYVMQSMLSLGKIDEGIDVAKTMEELTKETISPSEPHIRTFYRYLSQH